MILKVYQKEITLSHAGARTLDVLIAYKLLKSQTLYQLSYAGQVLGSNFFFSISG